MKVVILVLMSLIFNQIALTQEIQGVVKTADGKVLKDVEVNSVKTDEKGFFKTTASKGYKTHDDGKGVLFFKKKGFISLAKIVDLNQKELNVEMLELKDSDTFEIKNCSNLSGKKYVGNTFLLFIPKGAKKKSGFDIDYGYYSIGIGKSEKRQYLSGIFQGFPMSYPNPDWIKITKSIRFRVWKNSSGISGVSWEGETTDGKFWRYFAFNFLGSEIVEYIVNSKDVASSFDKIIDEGCIKFPDWLNDERK